MRDKDVESNEIVEAFDEDLNLTEDDVENYSLNIFLHELIRECYSRSNKKSQELTTLQVFGTLLTFLCC